jgi:putative ATP-dependent endonuclease of OLD family
MQIPTAVITDADPPASVFPEKDSTPQLSANATLLKEAEDDFVRCFFSKKTLEYDLALEADQRILMIDALKEMHPLIGKAVQSDVDEGVGDCEKAKRLYCGMFQRGETKEDVQKGRYSQVLAYGIATSKTAVTVPPYLVSALSFIIGAVEKTGG